VLIVDDDRDVALALADLLPLVSPRPMVISLAFDGRQAVTQALSPLAPPHVVILDMEMPLMNGLEAAMAFHHALPKPVDMAQRVELLEGTRLSE
jgi:YesN/AraC family two-component response regulator